jgi:hypothetical protein
MTCPVVVVKILNMDSGKQLALYYLTGIAGYVVGVYSALPGGRSCQEKFFITNLVACFKEGISCQKRQMY